MRQDDSSPKYRIEARKSFDDENPDKTLDVLEVQLFQVFTEVQKLFRDHPEIMRVDVFHPDGDIDIHTRPSTAPGDEKIETPAAPDSAAPVADTHELQADQPSKPVSLSNKVRKQLGKFIHGLGKGGDSPGRSANR